MQPNDTFAAHAEASTVDKKVLEEKHVLIEVCPKRSRLESTLE